MNLVRLTKDNLETEHVCCAISNNKDVQVSSKKAWLADRLDEGLVFLKGDVRGKCFIEYIPAEYAWAPVDADGYMYIDCLWVSGSFKGQGYSTMLFNECVRDSKLKGKKGLVALSSKKKLGFLSDPSYLKHKGFAAADTASPYFELMYLPFDASADKPRFKPHIHAPEPNVAKRGFALYYANQCPFTAKYVPLIEQIAKDRGAPMEVMHITTVEQAQAAPSPFTTYSLYYNGEFVTHEIQSEKKFGKLLDDKGL